MSVDLFCYILCDKQDLVRQAFIFIWVQLHHTKWQMYAKYLRSKHEMWNATATISTQKGFFSFSINPRGGGYSRKCKRSRVVIWLTVFCSFFFFHKPSGSPDLRLGLSRPSAFSEQALWWEWWQKRDIVTSQQRCPQTWLLTSLLFADSRLQISPSALLRKCIQLVVGVSNSWQNRDDKWIMAAAHNYARVICAVAGEWQTLDYDGQKREFTEKMIENTNITYNSKYKSDLHLSKVTWRSQIHRCSNA